MEAFISSFSAVALAEIGDKTQLLSLFLATRFRSKTAIIAGILLATLLNHAVSAWVGAWLAQFIPTGWQNWLLGGSFILVALWLLIPDKDDAGESGVLRFGAFAASCVLFFLAEIGDKTQIATVILAAHFEQAVSVVIMGTTLGMLAANIPAVFAGAWIMRRVPMHIMRYLACTVFIIIGVFIILS